MMSLRACYETTLKLVHLVWRRDEEEAGISVYLIKTFLFQRSRNQTKKYNLPAQAKIWDCSLSKHPKLWVQAGFKVLSLKIMLCSLNHCLILVPGWCNILWYCLYFMWILWVAEEADKDCNQDVLWLLMLLCFKVSWIWLLLYWLKRM